MGSRLDLMGQRFGWLVVIAPAENRNGKTHWKCQCDCGQVTTVGTAQLRKAMTQSCGCLYAQHRGKGLVILPYGASALCGVYDKYRRSARHRSVSFGLTKTEFTNTAIGPCHYCGDPGPAHTYMGIARLDVARGYWSTNVVSCCSCCSRVKQLMGDAEFLDWIARIAQHMEV